MRTRTERRVAARYRWDRMKVSFWFAPVIMAAAAVLLAWTMYWVDIRIPNAVLESSRFVLAGTSGEMRSALLSVCSVRIVSVAPWPVLGQRQVVGHGEMAAVRKRS